MDGRHVLIQLILFTHLLMSFVLNLKIQMGVSFWQCGRLSLAISEDDRLSFCLSPPYHHSCVLIRAACAQTCIDGFSEPNVPMCSPHESFPAPPRPALGDSPSFEEGRQWQKPGLIESF